MMKTRYVVWGSILAAALAAPAQEVVIESFDAAGQLVFGETTNASAYRVEWASAAGGPWTNTWDALATLPATGSGSVTAAVPMLYRVVATATNAATEGMVLVPAGAYVMGDAFEGVPDGDADERPLHPVTLDAFYVDATEVTKAAWDEVAAWAATNRYDLTPGGASGKAADHPAQQVTWYEAVKWCNARSERLGLSPCYFTDAGQSNVYRTGAVALSTGAVDWTAAGYRLPTEAEWEYAARGGEKAMRFPWEDAHAISQARANYHAGGGETYDFSDGAGDHPDYDSGGFPYTSPAGSFAANGYGLYDVAGNVWEWCWDRYADDYYAASPATNPRGPNTGSARVLRGGCWFYYARGCRVAYRYPYSPSGSGIDRGFRCVRGGP